MSVNGNSWSWQRQLARKIHSRRTIIGLPARPASYQQRAQAYRLMRRGSTSCAWQARKVAEILSFWHCTAQARRSTRLAKALCQATSSPRAPRAARQVVSSKSRFDPDMAEKRRTGRLVGPGHPVDPGVETFIGKRSHPERQRLRLEPERDHRAG